MTEKEFKKLKPGDKVKIVSKRTKSENGRDRWSSFGGMDKYLGKTMTVKLIRSAFVDIAKMMVVGVGSQR